MTDDLFAERDDDWWYRAILNYDRGSWQRYALGYRQAADLVVAALVDEGRAYGVPAYPDTVAFPVAFCYRHYLELMLKALIIDASRLLGKVEQPPRTHGLQPLWLRVRPKLEEIWPDEDFGPMEAKVKQFHGLDPTSEEFRFPFVGKPKVQKVSLQTVHSVSLLRLREIVGDLAGMLNGAVDGIDYLRGAAPEP